jgi:hypothetical protein
LCTSVGSRAGRARRRRRAPPRSTPYAVFTLTSVATSCGVPVRKRPPLPTYGPSRALAHDDRTRLGSSSGTARGVEPTGRSSRWWSSSKRSRSSSPARARRWARPGRRPRRAGSRRAAGSRQDAVRQGLAGRVPAACTEVVLGRVDLVRSRARRRRRRAGPSALGDDLGADAVPGITARRTDTSDMACQRKASRPRAGTAVSVCGRLRVSPSRSPRPSRGRRTPPGEPLASSRAAPDTAEVHRHRMVRAARQVDRPRERRQVRSSSCSSASTPSGCG